MQILLSSDIVLTFLAVAAFALVPVLALLAWFVVGVMDGDAFGSWVGFLLGAIASPIIISLVCITLLIARGDFPLTPDLLDTRSYLPILLAVLLLLYLLSRRYLGELLGGFLGRSVALAGALASALTIVFAETIRYTGQAALTGEIEAKLQPKIKDCTCQITEDSSRKSSSHPAQPKLVIFKIQRREMQCTAHSAFRYWYRSDLQSFLPWNKHELASVKSIVTIEDDTAVVGSYGGVAPAIQRLQRINVYDANSGACVLTSIVEGGVPPDTVKGGGPTGKLSGAPIYGSEIHESQTAHAIAALSGLQK